MEQTLQIREERLLEKSLENHMKIVIATDGSKFSDKAIKKACDLTACHEDACFKVIAVYEPQVPLAAEPYALSAEYFDQLNEAARIRTEKFAKDAVERIASEFPDRTVCVETLVEMGRPAQVIVDAAAKWSADLIVVGSHGHNFWGRLAIGSVSDAVVHHAPCSVLVVRTQAP